jgi:hypothetical protein
MVSCESHIPGSAGWSRLSDAAICSGDQSRSSRSRTAASSAGDAARRDGFGRRARSHVAASAIAARYRRRPLLRAISRDTVECERPRIAAIALLESPAAMPREISSRSATVSCCLLRARGRGLTPPCCANTMRTAFGVLRSLRAINRLDSPCAHRSHSSSSSSLANITRTSGSILPERCIDRLRPPSFLIDAERLTLSTSRFPESSRVRIDQNSVPKSKHPEPGSRRSLN